MENSMEFPKNRKNLKMELPYSVHAQAAKKDRESTQQEDS